jgi:hypothetical protein
MLMIKTVVPRSRKRGSIHPLPHTSSLRSGELAKHRDFYSGAACFDCQEPMATAHKILKNQVALINLVVLCSICVYKQK